MQRKNKRNVTRNLIIPWKKKGLISDNVALKWQTKINKIKQN